ncbi:hypothetical protein CW751_09740 [Brumimicrobium salinarum]|uniref:PorV/PorQ family protein n=1 Tax=Brumimicrobium salinarum TaxID=2058658 RepID=A0A2I0R241_9FLAO|nr:hypothetical protein CW751_09740 [Brumimicrobium salinarum]
MFLLILSEHVLAQDETIAPKYSNEFLQIGVGARALGMGNSIVAGVNDVTSVYWNPAGLTGVNKKLDVGLMHSEYFAGIAKYDYLGLAHSIDDKSSIGFAAIRFGVDNIPNTTQLIDNEGNIDYDRITTFTAADYGFLFSYGRKLGVEGLSVGGTVKVIHRRAGEFARSWGFGLDAGLQYKINDKWYFGAMARDITSTFNAWIFNLDTDMQEVFLETGNEIPENGLELTMPRLILAAKRKFDIGWQDITISPEINAVITTDGKRNTLIKSGLVSIDPMAGLEIGWRNIVAIRTGINNFQYVKNFDDSQSLVFQPNVGLGVTFKGITLDYAFTNIGNQSEALFSHVVSLKFGFK